MTSPNPAITLRWAPGYPVEARLVLAPHKRGPSDPATRYVEGQGIWRVTRNAAGPASVLFTQVGPTEVHASAWGPGAELAIAQVPDLLGGRDNPDAFPEPELPVLREPWRRHPGLRIGRTGNVMEALVPAVLEQKVTGKQAFGAWRTLVRKFGDEAPGPAPADLRVPPSAQAWRKIPSWEWHRAGVEPRASRTIIEGASVASRLEECTDLPLADAYARLQSIPGVGAWTAAEVAARALGDADALSVGDYHLAGFIGWALEGRAIDDDAMVALMEPWRPHRFRVRRLLELNPGARKPRFGPRQTIQDHRRN